MTGGLRQVVGSVGLRMIRLQWAMHQITERSSDETVRWHA
jgi:hypothetical protein